MELFAHAAEQLDKEYRCFLVYVEGNTVRLSPKSMNIGKKDCMELNRRFSIVNERYQSCGRTQGYYAVIDFFYFFSVRSGILQIAKKRGAGLAMHRSDQYERFFKLPAMARYILMMSVWIGEYEEVRRDSGWLFNPHQLFAESAYQKPRDIIKKPHGAEDPSFWGKWYITTVRLAALFHLVEIEWLDEQEVDEENKFRIRRIYATGELCALREIFKKQGQYFLYSSGMEPFLDVLKQILGKGAADMERQIWEFWENPVDSGLQTIVFQVKVGSCVRSIKIGDQYTLDELHYLIQKSVDFDMDHLYYFQMGAGSSQIRYYAPQCGERYVADAVTLAELHLLEGVAFEYLFDFGDEWCFHIEVSKILQEHTDVCEIGIIKGENPNQYDW